MTPERFPEANTRFGPPPDMTGHQVATIYGWSGQVDRGSCEGAPMVVVAWRPSPEDMQRLSDGGLVYLSMLGGLAPHVLTTDFRSATHIA